MQQFMCHVTVTDISFDTDENIVSYDDNKQSYHNLLQEKEYNPFRTALAIICCQIK